MELLNGGDLFDRIVARGRFQEVQARRVMRRILAAVGYLHSKHIVHRDLKPENIMYDPAVKHIKLLDFGIAADTDAAPDQRLTRAGFFVGTLMYVAPEALSGELVGPAADQYSLATIAYFLLTGCLPYTGKSPRELFSQLLTQPPVALNKAKPSLSFPMAVEAVVMKALSKAPAERYPSVKAFSEAFAEAANSTAMPSGQSAAVASGSGGDADAGKDKGGLFGKMKGLFGR
jgi:serine/threonine-protein kinase